MLLIQEISLTWGKEERGAGGNQMRRRFPLAHALQKERLSGNVMVHSLHFIQDKSGFTDTLQAVSGSMEKCLRQMNFSEDKIRQEIGKRVKWIKGQEYQTYRSAEDLNLTNLSVRQLEDKLDVTFFYDERRSGMPVRRGHNKDFQRQDSPFYRRDILNERAFVLSGDQYGRMIWNERKTDTDTGEWYYHLHIYNLYYLIDKSLTNDILVEEKPDFVYRQMGELDYGHWRAKK